MRSRGTWLRIETRGYLGRTRANPRAPRCCRGPSLREEGRAFMRAHFVLSSRPANGETEESAE